MTKHVNHLLWCKEKLSVFSEFSLRKLRFVQESVHTVKRSGSRIEPWGIPHIRLHYSFGLKGWI